MGRPFADHAGERFGRLVAVSLDRQHTKKAYWLFRCDCGTEKVIQFANVQRGVVRSCGCLRIELCKTGLNRLRHGDARAGRVARLHNTWRKMLLRCSPDIKRPDPRYAARGIRVCPEWQTYETFRDWALSNGYRDDLTIERCDNDGNYEPSNCYWIPSGRQAANRRTSRFLEYSGWKMTLADWGRITGIAPQTIWKRLRRGWAVPNALNNFGKPV